MAGLLFMSGYLWLYAAPLKALSGSEATADCYITEFSEKTGYSYGRALCIIDGKPANIILSGVIPARAGNTARLLLELEEAEYNPFSFSDGIVLHGKIKEIYSHEDKVGFYGFMRGLRKAAAERLDILGGDEAELCKGIMLGEKSGFSLRLQRDITYGGINYMTAVSGAHITLLIVILTEFTGKKHKSLQAALTLAIAALSAVFFGFSASVMRAGIMLILSRCGVFFSRRSDTLNSICAAYLLLTVFAPYAAVDPSLLMSVLGVFGVTILGGEMNRLKRFHWERYKAPAWLKETAVCSLCAMLCTVPISAACFGGISLGTVFCSVAVTPLFAAAIAVGFLYVVTGMELISVPLLWIMSAFRAVLSFFGELDFLWLAAEFTGAAFVLFLLVSAVFVRVFLPDCSDRAGTAILLAVTVFFGAAAYSNATRSRIDFVSNGRSGAAVVCKGSRASIIICGSGASLEQELYRELIRSGIKSIDTINAPQLDYSGAKALGELCGAFTADKVYCPAEVIGYAEKYCCGVSREISCPKMTVYGRVVACTSVKDSETSADIVMYYGYVRRVPESPAGVAVYVNSRQNYLPVNGINIYDDKLRIKLKE